MTHKLLLEGMMGGVDLTVASSLRDGKRKVMLVRVNILNMKGTIIVEINGVIVYMGDNMKNAVELYNGEDVS